MHQVNTFLKVGEIKINAVLKKQSKNKPEYQNQPDDSLNRGNTFACPTFEYVKLIINI